MRQPGIERLPLRPLTTGELLDAAVSLLRRDGRRLLPLAAVLATAEQFLLLPLRQLAVTYPPWYVPVRDTAPGWYWLLVSVGFGTECAILAVLGGQAARVAVPALVGDAVPPPARRTGPVAVLAVVTGLAGALCAVLVGVPWLVWFGFTGLAGPVLLVDRRLVVPPPGTWGAGARPVAYRPSGVFAALGRSARLTARAGLRPGAIRLLGYLAWSVIRFGLAAGTVQLLMIATGASGALVTALAIVAWALVDAVAYAALGCLDAVLHLETRMRVEGLDIALSQALRVGSGGPGTTGPGAAAPAQAALAVPR